MQEWFHRFAGRVSHIAGLPSAFLGAVAVILGWAMLGPVFGFSDTWQLVINTGTTIITFLMVFLIQHTQNRDALAMHLKLDELLRAVKDADNALISAEDQSDERLAELRAAYTVLRQAADALTAEKASVAASGPDPLRRR